MTDVRSQRGLNRATLARRRPDQRRQPPPGPWRELLSGVTPPGGPTAPADLLAWEPQIELVGA